MSKAPGSNSESITLDQLIALNDEISALVRAGVPLEAAFVDLGKDLPGRLGRIAAGLAERTSRGQPLAEALADRAARLPPVYRAVVEAGVKSGRLPAALDSLATTARRLAEARRHAAAAAVYPVVVLTLASGLLAVFCAVVAPRLAEMFDAFGVPGRGAMQLLADLGRSAAWWGWAVPLAVLVAGGVWLLRSRRAAIAEPRLAGRLLGWLPWTGRFLRYSRAAAFAEVLALLVENDVPLPEALRLAAEASGDRKLAAGAAELAESIRLGRQPAAAPDGLRQFPPLLRWQLASAADGALLLPALKHAAAAYRRRAEQQADLARVLLPVLTTVAVGGAATLALALALFLPYVTILKNLGTGP
jgi:type II secretory pathway component PulF